MEDQLTLDELQILLEAGRDAEHRRMKFAAALKGVDIDEKVGQSDGSLTGDDIKHRVELRQKAKRQGRTEEEVEFEDIGIAVIKE